MHRWPPAMAILLALGSAAACSDGGAIGPAPAKSPEVTIAYVTGGKITVVRPGERDIVRSNSAIGQSKNDEDSPGGLSWSENGRYVAWATAHPNLVGMADVDSGQVKTWPCPCTNGVFVGDSLIALDKLSGTLVLFSPDGRPGTRRKIRGPLATSKSSSTQIIGTDSAGLLVKTETGSKEWHVFRVLPSGESTRIQTSLPRIWTGDAHSRKDGTVAFGLASNGAACGMADKVALVSAGSTPSRVLSFPWSPTRWNVRRPEWGADGRLYVSATRWPPCSGQPSSVKDEGHVWELDGATWRYTGLRMLGFQPISATTAVMLRGTQTLSVDGLDEQNELVVAGPGGATRVIARMVDDYAVSPRSMSPFKGRNALLPAHPSPLPTKPPTPVLGRQQDEYQMGFGKVKPDHIFLGGDPTGDVQNVKWQSWGGQTAVADGTGLYVGENQIVAEGTPEPAVVIASNLGYCQGTYAYRSLIWYFPARGQTNDSVTPMDICEWR